MIEDAKFARDVALLLNGHHFPPVLSFYFWTNLSTEVMIFIYIDARLFVDKHSCKITLSHKLWREP
jgi:hypothetical protein